MRRSIDLSLVQIKINLHSGVMVVLLDRLAKEDVYGYLECAKNIFLTDSAGNVIWQVHTDFDSNSGSFTNIVVDGTGIKGYRWDGGSYEINLDSGKGTPELLMK